MVPTWNYTATTSLACGRDDCAVGSDEKRFACPVPGCRKAFRRRFGLKEHVATHTGEKHFVCPVASCGRGFATSGNLSRHKRGQHPWLDVPLECLVDGCACSFASAAKLERHMAMVHFSTDAHVCDADRCGRAFSTSGNLRRHVRQHHSSGELVQQQRQQQPQHYQQQQRKLPVAVDDEEEEESERRRDQVRSPTAVDEADDRFSGFEPPLLAGGSATRSATGTTSAADADLWRVLACLFE